MPPKRKRGPGQPPKPALVKRGTVRSVRFNKEEWHKIKKAALSSPHKGWSRWARNVLLSEAEREHN